MSVARLTELRMAPPATTDSFGTYEVENIISAVTQFSSEQKSSSQ